MTARIFLYELKKQLRSPKNIIVVASALLLVIVYLIFNLIMDSKYVSTRSTDYLMAYWSAQTKEGEIQKKVLSGGALTEIEQKQLSYWTTQHASYKLAETYSKINDDKDAPMLEINALIRADESFLTAVKTGLVDESAGQINIIDTQKRLTQNKYLYENKIAPVYSPYHMGFWKLLYNSISVLFPSLFCIVMSLLCSDSIVGECETGSFKFLLLQPISRTVIYASKLVAGIITSLVAIIISVLPASTIAGFINGFGCADYPVMVKNPVTQITGALAYPMYSAILTALPCMLLYILFFSAFCMFISAVVQTSSTAMMITIGFSIFVVTLAPYIGLAKLFIPFSYADSIGFLIDGNLGYYWICVAYTIVFAVTGRFIFTKKDIVC